MLRGNVCQALRDSRGGSFDIWRELLVSPSLTSLFGAQLTPGRGETPQCFVLKIAICSQRSAVASLIHCIGRKWHQAVFFRWGQGTKGSYSDSFSMQWTWREFLFSLSALNGNVQLINGPQKEHMSVSRQALSNPPRSSRVVDEDIFLKLWLCSSTYLGLIALLFVKALIPQGMKMG